MADWRSWLCGAVHGLLSDKLLVAGTNCCDTLLGAMNNDVLMGAGSGDCILGLGGDDTIIGMSGNDQIYGNDGEDTIYGDQGKDYLSGGCGNDFLSGGDDRDTLDGGAGADILNGGLGNDTLAGGCGNDVFAFDTALSSANIDIITDFKSGLDMIKLDWDIFTALADAGALSTDYFRSSATGMAGDANDFILYNARTGGLFYDADGNGQGAAVQFASLTCRPNITAADFMVAS